MKNLAASTVAVVLLSSVMCNVSEAIEPAKAEVNMVSHLLASNDVESVISALPKIYALWSKNPNAYIESAKQASTILSGATNGVARQALAQLFINTAESSILPNRSESSMLLKMKCDAMLQYFNIAEIRNDKSTWIAVARTVGGIRSQIIPGYVRQGVLNPLNIMDASSPQEVENAKIDNENKIAIDSFQQELRVTDIKLTMFLLENAKGASSDFSEEQKEEFVQALSSLARLNEGEVGELK